MSLKIPPQNIEAERAVLGSILIDNKVINNLVDLLKPEYFYDPRNKTLYESITSLYKENKAIDILTLTTELKKLNKVKLAGGSEYLSDIVNAVPTSANALEYALLIKESSVRRTLITYSAKFDELARKEHV